MKLELKDLAPYLPFDVGYTHKYLDLKVIYGKLDTRNIIELMNPNTNHCIILRPLSDLSSLGNYEIQINEHTINTMLGYGVIEFSHYKGDLDFIYEGDYDQRYDSSKTINFNTFEIVRNELLKGHYDLFGLIEKGLAIDINTL